MTVSCTINGLGFYLPKRRVSNHDLASFVDTSDEWITTRTGIRTRYFAAEGESASDLGLQAALRALQHAKLDVSELTHIIVASFTHDATIPSTACYLQQKLGVTGIPAFDISAVCSGFIYGLEAGRAFLSLHPEAKILVVGSEVSSSRLNFKDRTTCVLFGDGAGAAIISNSQPALAKVVDVDIRADGNKAELLTAKAGGSCSPLKLGQPVPESFFVTMEGRDVFKHAVRSMCSISLDMLNKHGLTREDIDLLIPHQANIRIIDAIGKKLDFPKEKIFINVDKYGNTSAASIPIALAEAVQTGRIQPGNKVVLTSFGSGFTWGAALLQF